QTEEADYYEYASNSGSGGRQVTAGDFVKWERIGRGGFGRVYRAQPRDAQQYVLGAEAQGYVAIKVVDKRALRDAAAEARLATEVAIHEGLDHPAVVQMHDSFEDERFVYMVLEYCERTDLWRYLRQRHVQATGMTGGTGELASLSEAETRFVVRQIAAAVAYMHSQGVLHRDLKLANILVARSMAVKVGDFGLATRVGEDATEPTTMCGTPSYISPEIMARQPYGFEADVWALGCLMVTLLTGAHPFRGVTRITEDVVARINLPRAVSSEARNLVYSMLRIDPVQRIRSKDLATHPFFSPLLSSIRLATPTQIRQRVDADRILPPRHPDLRAADDGGARRLVFHGARRGTQRHSESDAQYGPKRAADRHSRTSAEPAQTEYFNTRPQSTAMPRHGVAESTGQAPDSSADLATFSTRRLPPLKRAMKNGKVYLRADHLLVLDLTTEPTIVALNERLREIYEFRRPLRIDALSAEAAHRIHAWGMAGLPERVAKTVRMACRCVSFLRAQQKRIAVSTAQGQGWLFEDAPQASFRFSYFNGIKVELSRKRLEAVIEIPSRQDLPNEIQKIPLPMEAFPAQDGARRDADDLAVELRELSLAHKHSDRTSRVPGKVRGIVDHAMEALRRTLVFDGVLREFEEDGAERSRFDGQIKYPVPLAWDRDESADYVPPGLRRRNTADPRAPMLLRGSSAMPISTANTAGSTTVIAGNGGRLVRHGLPGAAHLGEPNDFGVELDTPPVRAKRQRRGGAAAVANDHQWGAHLLDQRTVNDTPTRRLNLGPITRLVEEFNRTTQPTPLHHRSGMAKTPGTVLRTPGPRGADATVLAKQTFDGACFIPDVGWCMAVEGRETDDYAITILFCDGCRILVGVRDQVATYRDAASEYTDLPFDHAMPARVKERLTWLPQFLALMGLAI
ncbi:hypothetical protein EV175_004680, partial [Coemansia sp. RSA 1933]